MLVSIIIPAHKTTTFLKSSVQSALRQTYEKIEVILVCNGNLKIKDCKDFLNIENSKLVIIKSEKGRHNARNKGMKIAKGNFLQFLDFDDLLYSTKIERQIEAIKNNKLANTILITKWNIINEDIISSKPLCLDYLFEKETLTGLELYKLLGKNKGYIMTASWLFPKNLFSKSIQWEDVPNDDALFASEIINQDTTIVTVPEILASYRNHRSNTRSLRTENELLKLLYSWKKIRKNLNFNHYLVYNYFYNAYFYLLKYAINVKSYKLISIYITFLKLGRKSKVPFKYRMGKSRTLLNKILGLAIKKYK